MNVMLLNHFTTVHMNVILMNRVTTCTDITVPTTLAVALTDRLLEPYVMLFHLHLRN